MSDIRKLVQSRLDHAEENRATRYVATYQGLVVETTVDRVNKVVFQEYDIIGVFHTKEAAAKAVVMTSRRYVAHITNGRPTITMVNKLLVEVACSRVDHLVGIFLTHHRASQALEREHKLRRRQK